MAGKELFSEGQDMMRICNSCRYCEGFCAVWRAMEFRREFPECDLNYLSNLCHDCSECYYACQYAPPHEWAINAPLTFAKIRCRSYEQYAWPKAIASAFRANGLVVSLVSVFAFTAFLFGVVYVRGNNALTAKVSSGNFYQIISHETMIVSFGLACLFSVLALGIGFVRCCHDIGERVIDLFTPSVLITTLKEVLRLEHLSGGGWGCAYPWEESSQLRRWFHHTTFYGFLSCFTATIIGFVYHYLFGWHAPHAITSLPVVFGSLGGIGLIVGPAGLIALNFQRNRDITDDNQWGINTAFNVLLLLASITGLLLLIFRGTSAMAILLMIHLGVVMALLLTLPYGKFVHGMYRFGAIAKYTLERKQKQVLGV